MEDFVTQRVNEFRQSLGLSILAFSKAIEVGQQTLHKQLKEDGCGVSITTVANILDTYPDLSAEWLLRGEGEMKKGAGWQVTQFVPVHDTELVDALKDHITTLKGENERLRNEIESMRREKSAMPIEYSSVAAEERNAK